MPIYAKTDRKTKKPLRGQYRVVLWVQGQRREQQFQGTKREAESFLARWQIETEAERPTDSRVAPSFSVFSAGRYRMYAEAHLADATKGKRKYTLVTLCQHFGDIPLSHIRAQDVEEFQYARLKTVGPVTVNDDVKILKAILNYARSVGLPAAEIKVAKLPEPKTSGRVKFWTTEEVGILYQAFAKHSPHLLGMTAVLINTGMRKGEALALEWSCVDLDKGMIKVHPNKEWRPKNNLPREIPIGSSARPWLEGKRESERWVFPTRKTGERYAKWPQRDWDKARVASKVGGSPHVCRHTYASHFLSARGDMFLLAQILGHTNERVTAIYSHLLPDHLERARDAVRLPVPIGLAVDRGMG